MIVVFVIAHSFDVLESVYIFVSLFVGTLCRFLFCVAHSTLCFFVLFALEISSQNLALFELRFWCNLSPDAKNQ